MKTRFSLRTLLVSTTLVAMGVAFVGNTCIERRRQQRLVEELLRATVVEGSNEMSIGYEDGSVQMILLGESLSEATVGSLIEAKRILWIQIWGSRDISPPLRGVLETEFIMDKPFPMSKWHRKGAPVRWPKRETWSLFQNNFYDRNGQAKAGPSP